MNAIILSGICISYCLLLANIFEMIYLLDQIAWVNGNKPIKPREAKNAQPKMGIFPLKKTRS